MNESRLARRIVATLEAGPGLHPAVVVRLAATRERALERHRVRASGFALAGRARLALRLGVPWPVWSRVLVPLAILVAAGLGVQRWEEAGRAVARVAPAAADIEEIDARLLDDELPIEAYYDQQFQSWLKHGAE